MIYFSVLMIAVGFCLLIWAAARLVDSAVVIARFAGMSSMMIGLTVVAFGTSLPEIVVSAHAALYGNPAMAIGNVVGSNIANICLVLGVTALLVPLQVNKSILSKELPILFFVMLFFSLLMFDGVLNRVDGLLLLIAIIFLLFWMFKKTKIEKPKAVTPKDGLWPAGIWFVIGLILLPVSSYIIVKNAVYVARFFHVSDLVIGLTILALGTSLPELATSIVGAYKKQYDLIIGNIIGSNIFNLLAVLVLPVLIKPIKITSHVLLRDVPIMIIVAIIFYLITFFWRRRGQLGRVEGCFLLLIYAVYIIGVIIWA